MMRSPAPQMMKTIAALFIGFVLLIPSAMAEEKTTAPPRLKIVASFSILGDMLHQVAGDRADISVLVGPDGNAHSFEPGPTHAAMLADADILVINGLGFEPWMVRLAAAARSKASYVTASYGVTPRPLPHDETGAHKGHDASGYPHVASDFDPHAWQNPLNGVIYVRNIQAALEKHDPENAATYRANAERYVATLEETDRWIKESFRDIPQTKRKVVSTHRAFGYYGDAYSIHFIALTGTNSGAEPGAGSLARMIELIRKEKISTIFAENMAEPRMMEVLARETGAEAGSRLYSDALSAVDGPVPHYVDMLHHNTLLLADAMRKNGE